MERGEAPFHGRALSSVGERGLLLGGVNMNYTYKDFLIEREEFYAFVKGVPACEIFRGGESPQTIGGIEKEVEDD